MVDQTFDFRHTDGFPTGLSLSALFCMVTFLSVLFSGCLDPQNCSIIYCVIFVCHLYVSVIQCVYVFRGMIHHTSYAPFFTHTGHLRTCQCPKQSHFFVYHTVAGHGICLSLPHLPLLSPTRYSPLVCCLHCN